MAPIHLREISSDGVILPGDVAAELYAARQLRGVDLHDISAELRIHHDQLLAIEQGRFYDLPGPAYVIGFLRSYAAYLDLDADDLVRRFKAETTEFDARQDLNALEPYDEGGVPTGALIALALALVVGAYGGWYYVANRDNVAIERVSEVPERLVAVLASEPAASPEPASDEPTVTENVTENVTETMPEPAASEPVSAAPVIAETRLAPQPMEADSMEAAPEPAAAREARSPEPAMVLSEEPFDAILAAAIKRHSVDETAPPPDPTQAAPISSEPLEAEPLETASLLPLVPAPVIEPTDYLPRVFGQANAGSTITLRAREESWVQVTGDNNELLLTRILRPGDVYHVPDRPGLMLMTGNAGGIEILVGGKLAPPLGEIGKVRRQVALDPAKLLAGTAIDP